jgi:hypothetical protein
MHREVGAPGRGATRVDPRGPRARERRALVVGDGPIVPSSGAVAQGSGTQLP